MSRMMYTSFTDMWPWRLRMRSTPMTTRTVRRAVPGGSGGEVEIRDVVSRGGEVEIREVADTYCGVVWPSQGSPVSFRWASSTATRCVEAQFAAQTRRSDSEILFCIRNYC